MSRVREGKAKKHSFKRDAILTALCARKDHPSARQIYEELKPSIPGLSLGTIYRNLGLFREEKAAASLGVVNGEERFDGRTEGHSHLICEGCGKVMDVPLELQEELDAKLSFKMNSFSIDTGKTVLYGYCEDCLKNKLVPGFGTAPQVNTG
ncbi:MAG: transcriptional repressor [Treponema sp.]|jgi:Fur family peroxide stress response transcriptional regulator|nr:transcriptional repressor [Treponema sp.]